MSYFFFLFLSSSSCLSPSKHAKGLVSFKEEFTTPTHSDSHARRTPSRRCVTEPSQNSPCNGILRSPKFSRSGRKLKRSSRSLAFDIDDIDDSSNSISVRWALSACSPFLLPSMQPLLMYQAASTDNYFTRKIRTMCALHVRPAMCSECPLRHIWWDLQKLFVWSGLQVKVLPTHESQKHVMSVFTPSRDSSQKSLLRGSPP